MRFVDELYQVFRILVPDLFPSVHTDVFCRSQKTSQIKTQKKWGTGTQHKQTVKLR